MGSLKEIRTRISSVKSTRQITSAMKMVSAAKLRRAQDAIYQMRPYAGELKQIMANVARSAGGDVENPYCEDRPVNKVLIIPITSNKGLCGAFNANVIKDLVRLIQDKYDRLNNNGQVDVVAIGKKGNDLLKSKKVPVKKSQIKIFDELHYENAVSIVEEIMQWYVEGYYDEVILIYNQFKNAGIQELVQEVLLPSTYKCPTEDEECAGELNYLYEPNPIEILNKLIPESVKVQFYKALLESFASEHGARMTSMHKATDNATELIKELTLHYNKARQASITSEILEIVGGAEALKG